MAELKVWKHASYIAMTGMWNMVRGKIGTFPAGKSMETSRNTKYKFNTNTNDKSEEIAVEYKFFLYIKRNNSVIV